MNRIAQMIVTLSMCLWLGGLIALFLFVSALFKHDRTVAIQGAPILFDVFAMYQIIVGLVGLIALLVWRSMVRSLAMTAMIVLFALSLGSTAYVTFSIIPEMTSIRVAGQSGDSPRFKQLHGQSMMFYSSQTIALLIAAMLLPAAISADALTRRSRGSVEARGFPVGTADPVAAR